VSRISKDYIFKKEDNGLQFIGDFNGLYQSEDNPWGQDGTDERLGDYYEYSRLNIIENLKPYTHHKQMLEIGSGLGYVVDFFNKNLHLTCDGADISSIAVEKARLNFPTYNFINVDIQSDNIQLEKKYDVIVLNQVLWYVLEKFENVFENVFNLLNKGGVFIITHAFIESQGYGKDIIDGFGGLVQYIENNQKDKFNLVNAQLRYKTNMLYKDGCVVMEKVDE